MSSTFWQFAAYFFWTFASIAYLFTVALVLVDLFRDRALSGWARASWILFLVFVPFLTVLVYVIVRGRGMSRRSEARLNRPTSLPDSGEQP